MRKVGLKPGIKTKKAGFKETSSANNASPLSEKSVLQTFEVTALDSVMLDLSRSPPQQEVIDYGKELLDNLDRLKGFLLMGRVPTNELARLKDLLGKEKPLIKDPRLHEIIREIEVRVAVELAKLQK